MPTVWSADHAAMQSTTDGVLTGNDGIPCERGNSMPSPLAGYHAHPYPKGDDLPPNLEPQP